MDEKIISPRIVKLKNALLQNEKQAEETFWQEIREQGTPIIEPLENDPENMLVTFLWHGNADTKNVLLGGSLFTGILAYLTADPVDKNQFTRLENSHVWYLTRILRKDLRTVYLLSENNPEKVPALFQPDPLNQQRFFYPADPEGYAGPAFEESILALPEAPEQPWILPRKEVPAGRIEEHRLKSEILDNERRVWVYIPQDYNPDGDPPYLLLAFDGWGAVNWVNLPVILDNLQAEGLIPPVLAIMPDSLEMFTTRGLELSCYPPFDKFLTQELLPWAEQKYSFQQDPAKRIVAGGSCGGLAAAYTGINHPELFMNVLSNSGAFFWRPEDDPEEEWLTRQYASTEKLPLRFYMDVGLLETIGAQGPIAKLLPTNRHLRTVLQAKGYEVHYAEFNGGHDPVCWRGTIANGLIKLIGKRYL